MENCKTESRLIRLVTEQGHCHDLDMIAIRELQKAKTGDVAEDIFNRFAPHVPRCDRGGIWFAVDSVK